MLVADISGKSIPAALFAPLLHGLILQLTNQSKDPPSIIVTLNSQMAGILPSDAFITLFCAYTKDNELTFANAGHEPPLLYKKEQEKIIELISSDRLPIGIKKEIKLSSKKINFAKGDVLLMFTDGISDSKYFRDKPFKRLKSIIMQNKDNRPQVIVDEILKKALPADKQQSPDDDIIAVCIKRA